MKNGLPARIKIQYSRHLAVKIKLVIIRIPVRNCMRVRSKQIDKAILECRESRLRKGSPSSSLRSTAPGVHRVQR